jgi:ferrous iron transport protein B
MNLSQLQTGESGMITKVLGRGAFRKRITEMGFVKGQNVTVIKNAPLKDPVEYHVMGYDISLRRSEASLIEVITVEEAKEQKLVRFNGVFSETLLKTSAEKKSRIINVVLVGNPNSGKTTIFNYASRSRERVGNYSGVTVDAKQAKFYLKGYTLNIIDLPGTYSLSAYSPEELYVRDYIANFLPDIVVNVVDASNLERNLYLTTQLIDMDIRVVMALNMYDELLEKGDKFDYDSLGKMIGIPIIPTIGSKNKGIRELFSKVIEVYEDKDQYVRHVHINYGEDIEASIKNIQGKIKIPDNLHLTDKYSSRFLSIKMLERDSDVLEHVSVLKNHHEIRETADREIIRLEDAFKEDSETLLTDAKYGFIAGALRETYQGTGTILRKKSEVIDNYITHKMFGFPIFIFFMWLMFQATFSLGAYPMDWIEMLVGWLGSLIETTMPEGSLKDLLVNGIIGGVGGVIVFLPNILILFFFISLMEDTGYMARAAFIMDKLMHKIGLHGKSFIPLIMGFGCNVPAIMATRTIENRNNRLLTMLINPFMSCSARLPVYILIIGAFFPNYPGTVLFSIYFFGIITAIVVSIVFKKIFFRGEDVPFVMELPPYRLPTLRSTTRHMWYKGSQYLKKMGGIILIASIIVWALGHYPRNTEYTIDYNGKIEELNQQLETTIPENFSDELSYVNWKQSAEQQIEFAELEMEAERQINSYIGRLGHFIEPAIRPLGFDWKMGISLLSGVAAKEIVVSTMGVIYQPDPTRPEGKENLSARLRHQVHRTGEKAGQPVITPLIALSFLVFILIYFPCVAVIAAIKNESGSWKWAVFTIFYTTGLAWILSFIVYQVGGLIL